MHARTLRAVLDIEIDLDAVPDFDPAVLDLAAIESLPPAKRRAVKHMIDKVRFIAAGYDRPLLFEAASDRRNTGRLGWQAAVEADMQQKTRTGKHDCAQWARDMLAADFLAACNEKGVEPTR